MAGNVFGNPITDLTLKGLPEFVDKVPRRADRARVARERKTDEDKHLNARKCVDNMKTKWGVGVSTLCLIYNATGDPITLVRSYDWYGHIGPDPYPLEIANGQWGVFLHVKVSGAATGSVAAVIYRGRNNTGHDIDWLLCWENPWNKNLFRNNAYTIVGPAGCFDNANWSDIKVAMSRMGLKDASNNMGCSSNVIIGDYTSPTYEAIVSLDESNSPQANNAVIVCSIL